MHVEAKLRATNLKILKSDVAMTFGAGVIIKMWGEAFGRGNGVRGFCFETLEAFKAAVFVEGKT